MSARSPRCRPFWLTAIALTQATRAAAKEEENGGDGEVCGSCFHEQKFKNDILKGASAE